MRKSANRLAILLLVVVVLMSVGACSTSPAATTAPTVTVASVATATPTMAPSVAPSAMAPVTLKLWHIWASDSDGNTAPFKRVLDAFTAANLNITLDVEGQATDYYTKLNVAIASGNAPDIMYAQGLGVMKPYVDGGKIAPMDEFIDKYGTKNNLVGGALDYFTFDNKVYALPISMSIATLFCNKELFDNNGLALPVTLDDLVNDVKVFSAKGITPMEAAVKDQWPSMMYYDILAVREMGASGALDALNGKTSFDQQGFTDAASQLLSLVNSKGFNESCLATSWDEAQQIFISGKAAMLFNGSWVASTVVSDNSLVKDKIVALKFPTIAGAAGKDTEFLGGCFDSFMINANTVDKDAAFRAISWINSDMAKESYIAGSGLPAWTNIGDIDTSKINPLMIAQANLIKDATGFCPWWDTALGGARATAHQTLVTSLFSNKISAADYSKQMVAQCGPDSPK